MTVTPQPDPRALEQLVLSGLDDLGRLAHASGDTARAARLEDAARLVRERGPLPNAGLRPLNADLRPLTDRQAQVAMLVARGYSNRRIARELVVSERTVDTHVSHILRRLLLASRAQIAAWAVSQSPPRGLEIPQSA